jgi:formate/nitrite transporter FocA (FNT family)
VKSEEELAALRESMEEQSATVKRNSSDVLKLGIMAGACLGVALIVLAVFLAG